MPKFYLVGGAVRDLVLQHLQASNAFKQSTIFKDLDYVVVGATPQHMLTLGYTLVGKDFPVFLHPHNKQEYALARTERKTSVGYQGFSVKIEQVTLEEDLKRRDLTINSMAIALQGDSADINELLNLNFESLCAKIIDPFNGLQDLKQGILRHTSSAFIEDPLRLLRLARFRARFNMTIAPQTYSLIVQNKLHDEIKYLSKERIMQEWLTGLNQPNSHLFLQTLQTMQALNSILMPHMIPTQSIKFDEALFKFIQQAQHVLTDLMQNHCFTLNKQNHDLINLKDLKFVLAISLLNFNCLKQTHLKHLNFIEANEMLFSLPNSIKKVLQLMHYLMPKSTDDFKDLKNELNKHLTLDFLYKIQAWRYPQYIVILTLMQLIIQELLQKSQNTDAINLKAIKDKAEQYLHLLQKKWLSLQKIEVMHLKNQDAQTIQTYIYEQRKAIYEAE